VLVSTCQELAREMAAGCERSVLLMIAALSLFRVCAGQLSLRLRRQGVERNNITLTCFDRDFVEVRGALFYMRVPGSAAGMRMDVTGSGLQNFSRVSNGAAITFIITRETEAIFTCARNATSNEAPGLLVAAFRPVQPAIPDQFLTVFPRENVSLKCGIQPGRARELYSVQWFRNNEVLSNQRDFSLSVSVESMSQNGSVYRCTVEITSCSPISTGCSSDPRTVDGNRTTLIVGGE